MNPLRSLFLALSRMPPAIMLVVIILLAVVVTSMVTGHIGETEKQAAEREAAVKAKYEQKSKVVFSTKDIAEGATITADALEEKDVEAGKVPIDALASSSMAVGRIAKGGIPAGQVVSSHDLQSASTSGPIVVGFESKIKEGYRAVTFGVDGNSGVAGFIAPGSHVDIIASVGSGNGTKAQPILGDVEVIAVGANYQKVAGSTAATPGGAVTVAVTPEDAQKLIRGVMAGKLYLTLRNEKDHSPVAVTDITSMFEKPAQPKEVAALPPPGALPPPPMPGVVDKNAAPPPPPLHEIEQWTGSKKDIIQVPKN